MFKASQSIPRLLLATTAFTAVSSSAFANFLYTDAGPYDFNDTANWSSATINNTWGTSLTANQTITFAANTTLSSTTLSFTNTSTFNHTLVGSGGDYTLTLTGNISAPSNTSNSNTSTVTIGSGVAGSKLNIDLGSSTRTMFVGTNRTIEILDVISGTGGISKTGVGTLKLTNTANTFTGSVSITSSNGGVLEVTKLADKGEASSIGAGTGNVTFGGSGTSATLRYVGSGDSTNRTFVIGSAGATFDASGTGAIKYTSTASPTQGASNISPTITLAGTNTDDNTMSASFINYGTGTTSLLKQGTGRWVLAGTSTYTGTTTVEAGTLELGAANRIADTSNLVMAGGTFATGGYSETLGTLTLSATSTIDLGSGDSDLVFADSSLATWGDSISLNFVNFTEGVDSIRFGTDENGLTLAQLGKITINGSAAYIDSSGFLTIAIPESSSFALIGGATGLLLAIGLRRRGR